MITPSRLFRALKHRWVDAPRGAGRPVPGAVLDGEYATGNWDHFFARHELPRQAVLAALIRDAFPTPPRVLDLGCGSGRLASLFRPDQHAGWLGVDLSQEGLARARALDLPKVELTEGDYETWRPLAAVRYEAIVFNECIGYARSPVGTLRAFAPWLALTGRFFISHFRHGNNVAQWRAMEAAYPAEFACTVGGEGNRIWDLRILKPVTT
jgi:SAM-dependent methyltransferase